MSFEYVPDVALIVLTFVVTGMIYSIVSNTLRRKQQNAIHSRLLEKFTSSQDFSNFLQTPGGQQYMSSLMEGGNNSSQMIVNSMRIGIVVGVVGGGLFVTGVSLQNVGAAIAGVIMLLVGVGLVLSAFASYKLSSKLGLIRNQPELPRV
jgi:small-conductance mechanosensitive channel